MRRTIQQLQPGTCGLCRVLFVGYKIFLRNSPEAAHSTLAASLAEFGERRLPLELSLVIPTDSSKRCSGLLITGTDDTPRPWKITEPFSSTYRRYFGWEDESLEATNPTTACKQELKSDLVTRLSRGLDNCAKQHEKSCCISNAAPLPSRLLDVRSTSGEVHLVETRLLQTTIQRYNCLSHCWGTQQPLKTTQQNYSQHLASIAWDTIPKTFQDAIQLTRDLGVRYLWIDSLCIIQDNAEDWDRESANMCNIYGNSRLKIAVTLSRDCQGGLKYWSNRELFKITGFAVNRSPVNISLVAIHQEPRFRADTLLFHRA